MSERIAIAVMSFDRPHYLERVLQTVVNQEPFRALTPEFHLFQDGGPSPRTGNIYGDAERMEMAQKVFARHVPAGTIHASEVNHGVAMNFDRAERMLFVEMGYDSAIFLEDDLLLQPGYFRIMEALLALAAERTDIGMVSARGYRNHTPIGEQRRRAREICLMDEHNWAFGMRREAWEARDKVLRPYLDMVSQVDYRERDKGEMKGRLKALQMAYGRHGKGYWTSQDSMKNMAFELLGKHRITTFTNNARYIGKEGLHSTADKFEQRGYARTVLYDAPHEGFDMPSPDDLRRMRLELHYR